MGNPQLVTKGKLILVQAHACTQRVPFLASQVVSCDNRVRPAARSDGSMTACSGDFLHIQRHGGVKSNSTTSRCITTRRGTTSMRERSTTPLLRYTRHVMRILALMLLTSPYSFAESPLSTSADSQETLEKA